MRRCKYDYKMGQLFMIVDCNSEPLESLSHHLTHRSMCGYGSAPELRGQARLDGHCEAGQPGNAQIAPLTEVFNHRSIPAVIAAWIEY